jgi:hypothetical protein
MIRRILPCVAVALFLSACSVSSLERWQDSLFVGPPPTQAQVKQAMAYVGASDLPLPIVTEWSREQMSKVPSPTLSPVTVAHAPSYPNTYATYTEGYAPASFYIDHSHVIVVGPSWNLNGGGEALLVQEAYNYTRGYRGLPPDECGGYRIRAKFDDEQGWYGAEHGVEDVMALLDCRRTENGWQVGVN